MGLSVRMGELLREMEKSKGAREPDTERGTRRADSLSARQPTLQTLLHTETPDAAP